MYLRFRKRGVATIAPMKRGLKVGYVVYRNWEPISSNHCPDEKGTESCGLALTARAKNGSNHCPDEKGTESLRCLSHCRK